jgi:hypothetical protein
MPNGGTRICVQMRQNLEQTHMTCIYAGTHVYIVFCSNLDNKVIYVMNTIWCFNEEKNNSQK